MSIVICKSLRDVDNNIKSSAYMNILKKQNFIEHPILAEFIFSSKSSMYTSNRIGEIMPPCHTPASKRARFEKQTPHLTTVKDFSSQQLKMLINLKGQFRASNLLKRVKRLTFSKVLGRSKGQMFTVESSSTK